MAGHAPACCSTGVTCARLGSGGLAPGEAGAVELHTYRIFESGDPYPSSFAIATAAKDAPNQGCEMVGLSIGDSIANGGCSASIKMRTARQSG